jgi:hypothetical protein
MPSTTAAATLRRYPDLEATHTDPGGSLTTTPDRVRTAFPEISSRAWEHPADRAALVTLRTLKGFDTVFRTISGLLQERQHRLMYLATSVRVDERQFSDLHDLRSDCVRILGRPRS